MTVTRKKKVAKKKITKKKATAKKKVAKKKATPKKKIEDDIVDIDSQLASFGVSVLKEDDPEEAMAPYFIPLKNKALQKITGGIFGGKFFEIGADSQAGKSFLLYELAAEAINMGGYAMLLDAERALEEAYAKMVGLNLRSGRFVFAEKRTAKQKKAGLRGEPIIDIETFFKLALAFAKAIREKVKDDSLPILIGIDSYPVLRTKDMSEKLEKGKDADNTDSWRRASKFNTSLANHLPEFDKLGVCFVVLNQLTKNYGVMFGDPWESNNENKINFYATQRLKGRLIGKIKDKKTKKVIGAKTKWTTIKNRGVVPHQKVETKVYYNKGVDPMSGLEELLIEDETIRNATQKNPETGKSDKGFKMVKGDETFYPSLEALTLKHPEVLEPVWTGTVELDDIDEDVENVDMDMETDNE